MSEYNPNALFDHIKKEAARLKKLKAAIVNCSYCDMPVRTVKCNNCGAPNCN